MAKPHLYHTWISMKQRCGNPRNSSYNRYGARGIRVCERWSNSFAAFVEDMGPRPEGYTLDRINNFGNYEPSNCRWATPIEQSHNSRVVKMLVLGGEAKTVDAWARIVGLHRSSLQDRLAHMDLATALRLPKRPGVRAALAPEVRG